METVSAESDQCVKCKWEALLDSQEDSLFGDLSNISYSIINYNVKLL